MSPTVPIWAVEVDEHAVTAVRVLRTPENALELLAWWSVPVPPGADPVECALDALRRRGLRDHALQIVLPGRAATCRSFRISPEDTDLSPGELERELHDFTPFEPEEIALRARRLGGPGVLDYRIVAERRGEPGRWETRFQEAGFRYVGFSLHPAALLAAMESLKLGPPRGYALALQGAWSTLTAVDGALSVRFPIPFGMRDLVRRIEEGIAAGGPGLTVNDVLDAIPGSKESERAWEILLAATAALGGDVRRCVEFHRASLRGTGEETMLLAGSGTEHAGLRAALAQRSPVPLMPLLKAEDIAPLRPGPKVRADAMLKAMPLLIVPLGAALSATGLAPRDLDFRHLPEALPVPRERSLYPAAAAVLAISAGAACWLAAGTRDAFAAGEAALSAIPEAPRPSALPAEEGRRKAEDLLAAAAAARRRAALARSAAAVVAAFPPVGEGEVPGIRLRSLRISRDGDGYGTALEAAPAGPDATTARGRERLAAAVERLTAGEWFLRGGSAGPPVLRRTETDGGEEPR